MLKLTKKNGIVDHYYLDKESYYITRVETTAPVNGMETEVVALMSNYNDVDGYKMPFTTEQQFGGQTGMVIHFDEVKINIKVDDSIFSKPSGN